MAEGQFTPLSEILPTIASHRLMSAQLSEAKVCHTATTILRTMLGDTKGDGARAVSFTKNCLTLQTVSSAQAQEIMLRKMEIMALLREKGMDVTSLKTLQA